jgi:hypothetical protein
MIAEGYAQLVAHVLAHVDLGRERPGNMYDPRYVAWSRTQLDPATQAMLEHDAALIGARWRARPGLDLLHEQVTLHADRASFRRTAGRSLAQLDPSEVAAPDLLARMLASPADPVIELLHACLALLDEPLADVLRSCAPALERARAEVEVELDRLRPVLPALGQVELAWAMGRHGRVFGSGGALRVSIGAPAAWNGLSPARQALLAAHEQLVASSAEPEYLGQEWFALTELSRRMATLDDAALRAAHAAWLAELELCHVLAGAAAAGWVPQSTCARLLDRPGDRAWVLAELDLHRRPGHLQG